MNAPECTVAIAGPVYPDQLGAAFSEATGTLQSALVFDKRGLVTADQIGILQAVADYPQVAQRLEARYVTPIQANVGKPDEILDSVWAYLQCQRSIKQASVALSIHVNTLRYRLAKFESTVGAQLDDTQTLVEMWWVMQSRQRSKSTH
ncbi:helix-turn-helix domain-containing protein [Rhodococcus sp. NPDC056960]|uniref:helix-turn-helix domain-containing protein n=1 Tax=Rhodococcus sp. NPDC056960 TaxID=3345982 RepID=UPI003632CF06